MMAGAAGLCFAEKFLSAHILAKFAPALVAPLPMLGVCKRMHCRESRQWYECLCELRRLA